jgi:hypothetical protein
MALLWSKAWLAGSMLALLASGGRAATDSVDAVEREFRAAHKERALGVDKCPDGVPFKLSDYHGEVVVLESRGNS